MKNFFLSFLLLGIFVSNAQIRKKGTIELAPQIGSSSAQYYGDGYYYDLSSISDVTYGVGADYFFNDRWSLHSGLFVQTMGASYYGNYQRYNEELKYITLPVCANWHFGSTRKWYLNFGTSFGYLTSLNINGKDNVDLANRFQMGINVGIGYKIEITKKFSILVDYQSLTGLNDVTKTDLNELKNSFGSFNVGGVFTLK